VHVGHARRDLLARCEDGVDAVDVADGLENLDRVAARYAIDVGHATVDQRTHHCLRGGSRVEAHAQWSTMLFDSNM
jgi:hypothetical protein